MKNNNNGANGAQKMNKETNYCRLLDEVRLTDNDSGYTIALEKIFIKNIERQELRIGLYKDLVNRGGKLQNRLIMRPVDMTEDELFYLLELAYKKQIISDELIKKLSSLK